MLFYIASIRWDPNSGGLFALNRLAHEISLLGEKVFLVADSKNPKWEGELYNGHKIDYDNSVIIYPEVINGNPLNFKHVVRWLLNTPGVLGGDGIYGMDDLIYKFAPYFKAPDESKVTGMLSCFDSDRNKIFTDCGQHQKGITCYLVRKATNKMLNQHWKDSINIDRYAEYGGDAYLSDIFNKCDTFICYDHACYIAVQAALCGCNVIVIPDSGTTKERWKTSFPYFRYGIAYGFGDQQWAKETKDKVPDHLASLQKESLLQIKELIKKCKSLVNL